MKKHSLFNRILSGILAVLTVVSLIPMQASSAGTEELDEGIYAAVQTEGFKITVDGEEKATLTLRSHEKIEICADGLMEAAQYQWQIQHPEKEGVWINIYDATSACLNVTLALVKNMLTLSRTTQLRCRAIVNEEPQFTPVITVIHDDTVVSAPVVIPEETTEPTEAATEPTTPVETTVPTEPVETTVPTEPAETTEPTVPETTAPVVIPEETVAPTEETIPVETTVPTEATEPVQTEPVTEPTPATEPAETVAPTEVAQTTPATEPVEAVTVTEPVQILETVAATEPAAVLEENHSQAEAMAAAETAPAEIAPVETVAETAPVATEPEAPIETQPAEEQGLFAALMTKLTGDRATAQAMDAEAQEFVTVRIDFVRYDFARDENHNLIPDAGSLGGYKLEEEGSVAFTSYVATLQSGTDLNTVVPVPSMVGYNTYLNDSPVTSVTINETNITGDIQYTVAYRPALVNYSVRYYFQNIYDDLYVENTSLKVDTQGYTGLTPPDSLMKKDVPGYLPLYYQPDTIAADGSTVFEVYYERNYYLMEFDCNGGYGTETLYNRYGSYISVPNPVKSGYIFAGWDLVSTEESGLKVDVEDGTKDDLPTEMPDYNTAYKALWTTDETTYTVVYWAENADDTGYSYWGSRTVDAHSNDRVSGTDHKTVTGLPNSAYFTYNPVKTQLEEAKRTDLQDGKVVVQGDGSTIVNVYYSRKYYTITFRATGTCTAHVHGADCEKQLLCGQDNHVHDDTCTKTLTCTIPEHKEHTVSCLTCVETEHTHSAVCCNLTEHVHSTACCSKTEHPAHTALSCYTTQTATLVTSGEDWNRVVNITNPKAATVYKYRYRPNRLSEYTYYNYFYDGANWYYLGTGTDTNSGYAGIGGVYINQNNSGWTNNYKSDNTLTVSCAIGLHTHGDGSCNTSKCGLTAHTHGDGNCSCATPKHTHSASCYKDTLHTHKTSCYHYECTNIHVHTSACYGNCIYPDHTHGSNCTKNQTNIVKLVTRKYGADISDIWPVTDDHGKTYDDGQRWTPSNSSYYNAVLVFLKTMPPDDFTLTVSVVDYDTFIMHYYIEVVDGEPYEVEHNGKKFKLAFDPVYANYNHITEAEDFFDIEGFDQWTSNPAFSGGSLDIGGGGNVYFYYTRSTYTLKFHDYNVELTDKQRTLQYEGALHDYEITAENVPYPSTLEPGAYFFDGWYTTPECFDGTEVDWDTMKMPNKDLILYAKWSPILRNVTFYTLYSDIAGGVTPFLKAENVPHGRILGSTYNKIPSAADDSRVTGYEFIGWFYMDEDNKKRFAPDSMEVTRDLEIFAEWRTSKDTTYEVKYVLESAVGAENTPSKTAYPAGYEIADVSFAHSSVGKTKTFTAKALGDLLPDFRAKFFPTVNTHSILMQEDSSQNNYTFLYVYDDEVYFKVRYLEAGTNKVLKPEAVRKTEEAVITEKFLPVSGYIPTNYYIRKTLASDGTATAPKEENVITFYYVKDTEHGMYSFEYYLENADSDDYTNPNNYSQYESIVGTADLNVTMTAEVRQYEGYSHVPSLNTVITYKNNGDVDKETVGVGAGNPPSGKVTANGLTIKLYYERNQYPYIIEYREYGAPADAPALKLVKDGSDSTKVDFGSKVTYKLTDDTEYDSAKNTIVIDGKTYVYYIADPDEEDITKSIDIRAFKTGETNPNKMIFYFIQKKVEVHYEVVERGSAVTGLCRVSMASESATAAANLAGASAMPAEGFAFVGWFLDEAGNNPVDSGWVSDEGKKLKPQTLDTSKDDVYYYALFEPIELNVTYDEAGGSHVPDVKSHIGEIVTLPTNTTRAGYTLIGWWYDADGDGNVDEGEEYAPGAAFTMPGRHVHFVAQWIDERFDKKHGVFVGLNMSFYRSGDQYYYKFPPGEPIKVDLEAARAYISSIGTDGKNTWAVQEGYWDNALCKPGDLSTPAEPRDYIDSAIMNPDTLVVHGDVIGVFDETGVKTKELLSFTEDDYKAIVQAWLDARTYFKDHFAHYNINWDLLPMDADLYEAVPYVIKRHYHGLLSRQRDDWFIDFVILPKNRFEVKYELNLPAGFTDTAPVDENRYGQGMYVDVKNFHDVPYGADPRYVAKFVGWTAADKDGNPVAIDSKTNKFTMPGSNVTLTAQWEFCAPLTIAQTGLKENESAIYRVTGEGVDLTVSLTGDNDQVTILELPLGEYTVTEITGWTWKHDGSGDPTVTITEPDVVGQDPAKVTLDMPGPGSVNSKVQFDFADKTTDWLHGESCKENVFQKIS